MTRSVTRRRAVARLGSLVVAGSLAGCSGDGGGGGGGGDFGGRMVELTDELVFEPAELPVDVGQTVRWENVGSAVHTVTAYEDGIPDGAAYFASGGFDSEQAARDGYPDQGGIAEGETYEHTFEVAGTYEYFCIPHEGSGMKGTLEVSEEGPQL